MLENQTHCEHCGASLKKYWSRISPGHVRALIKFRHAISIRNKNAIHLINDLRRTAQELTPHEWNNWTKLRYHGLTAKVKGQEGYWLLTHRGAEFLNGKMAIPRRVLTFRNKVIAKDEELVYIKDVIGELPIFDSWGDIEWDTATQEDLESAVIVGKIKRAKKGSRKCPQCSGKLKTDIRSTETTGSSVIIEKWDVCTTCHYKEIQA